MSVQPEFILRAVIVRGFATLRRDSRLIDQLFRNLDQQSLQEIRNFIVNKIPVDLSINYPRAEPKVPAVVILLRSENETVAYLGDSMGMGTIEEFEYDGEDVGVLGGTASTASFSGQGTLEFGPYTASSATNNTIKVSSNLWSINKYSGNAYKVHIVGGTGRGQVRDITANTQNTLMVSQNWITNPNSTSIFEIRGTAQDTIGEPSKLFDTRSTEVYERLGAMNTCNYQLQVISSTPEEVVIICTFLKAILFSSKTFLESQGIINLKMSATDLSPRTDYMPDISYMRVINLEFMAPFDIFENVTIATEFRIALEQACNHELTIHVSSSTTTGDALDSAFPISLPEE
jgi:hypothetical protein